MARQLAALPLMLFTACGDVAAPQPKQQSVDLAAVSSPAASDFSSEATLPLLFDLEILPHFESGVTGAFEGVEGVEIVYRIFEVANEKGAIVLLPGRGEPVRKYAEVIRDLTGQGYSVYAMDFRGQGESGRMVSNRQMSYVEFFADYAADIETFVQTVVRQRPHPQLFLLAHSMGGAAAALYLKENPGVVDAVVLSSPMFEIDMGAFPASVGASIAWGACSRGSGEKYVIGHGDYEPATFENDRVTGSRARFDMKMAIFEQHPDLRMGGVSYRWLCEAVAATARIREIGANSGVPTLLLQAGADQTARPDGQNRYCRAAARCQMVAFADARHEILMERDGIRNVALMLAVRFFDHFSAGGAR